MNNNNNNNKRKLSDVDDNDNSLNEVGSSSNSTSNQPSEEPLPKRVIPKQLLALSLSLSSSSSSSSSSSNDNPNFVDLTLDDDDNYNPPQHPPRRAERDYYRGYLPSADEIVSIPHSEVHHTLHGSSNRIPHHDDGTDDDVNNMRFIPYDNGNHVHPNVFRRAYGDINNAVDDDYDDYDDYDNYDVYTDDGDDDNDDSTDVQKYNPTDVHIINK